MRKCLGVSVIGLALLASCVKAPPPPSKPAPAPSPAPAPTPPPPTAPIAEWSDRPATPGDWTYQVESDGSSASFGTAAGAPRLVIRCDRTQRRISFARPGVLDPGNAARLTINSTAGAATYALSNAAGNMVAASVAASDPFLDRLVYTRGRFLVRTDGQPDMVIPAYAEVSRVLEDCRA